MPAIAPRRYSASLVVLFALVLSLGLTGCDSEDPGPPPSDLEGSFVFTRFELTVSGVKDFSLLDDTLRTSSDSPRMEFFGGNATANLVYQVEGDEGSSLLAGQFTTSGNRLTVDFSEAREEDRFQLLLPPVVRFQIEEENSVLVANQEVQDVNLREYAPGRYGGLTQNVNGTLRLRLERVTP
jgi:hypothetical protein